MDEKTYSENSADKPVEQPKAVLETRQIQAGSLKGEILLLKDQGYRFVTITCVDLDQESVDLIYTFDRGLEMVHLRIRQPKAESAPSVSDILFAAFLVENEIQDQFGICFDGLVLDFQNRLYLEEEVARTPFCRYNVTRNSK